MTAAEKAAATAVARAEVNAWALVTVAGTAAAWAEPRANHPPLNGGRYTEKLGHHSIS